MVMGNEMYLEKQLQPPSGPSSSLANENEEWSRSVQAVIKWLWIVTASRFWRRLFQTCLWQL